MNEIKRACGLCDGTGYVEGPTSEHVYRGDPYSTTSVVNCRCTIGQQSWNATPEATGPDRPELFPELAPPPVHEDWWHR